MTPGRVVVATFSLWLLIFTLAPVEPRWSSEVLGYLLLILGIVALFAGFGIANARQSLSEPVFFSERICRNAILICSIIGIFGLGFKLYDVFVLRGISVEQDFVANRAVSARVEAGGISIIAAIL